MAEDMPDPIAVVPVIAPTITLEEVYWVRASSEPGAYTVGCRVTDFLGNTSDCEYFARPSDPHGLCPVLIKWIAENPEAVEG